MSTPTLKMTEAQIERARLLETSRIIGDLLREERRADDAELAREFAESDRGFWRLVDRATNERE